jgi:hypothetical protein
MSFLNTSIAARGISSALLVVASLFSFQTSAKSVITPVGSGDLRDPENPDSTTDGLNYDYYEGTWEALPDFTGLAAMKFGSLVNIDLAPRNRENDFAFRFTGYINAPADGTYTFYLNSDDGSRFDIGTTTVVNNDGMHDAQEASGSIGLKKGKHAITITYFSHLGASVLIASWAGPGIAKQLIPATAFSRMGDPVAAWRLEAERAVLTGPVVLNSSPGYTGGGFADYQVTGDNILWFGVAPTVGLYQLTFRYSLANAATTMRLEINTTVDTLINFPSTESWTKWSIVTFKILLNAGSNTIRLASTSRGDLHLDHLIMGYPGVTNVVVATDDDALPTDEDGSTAALVPYPNPSAGKLFVDWQTPRGGSAEIELINFNGAVMKSEKYGELHQGMNTLEVNAEEVKNGVYWIRVKQGGVRKAASVVIQR